jgi:hypothetical protein
MARDFAEGREREARLERGAERERVPVERLERPEPERDLVWVFVDGMGTQAADAPSALAVEEEATRGASLGASPVERRP